MDATLKERFFLAGQESPGSWMLQGLSLKAASARLDWEAHPARDDEPTLSFLAEYHMLLGLAFENVLKGFISLVRLEKRTLPPLPRECHVHRLEDLAIRPECAELALTATELETLARLSPYIEWAGRYPVPKRSSEMIAKLSSNREREKEEALWERLVPLLHERAWVMKGGPKSMGGYKLHMKRRV
ncbi:MAG: hypothetical protein HYU44_03525 [Betaproteobacteria bacterium]|nr:hypothetical protein [Betaproteobacteria bacterium]